jgi:DNA-binding IclR family transcriptional regulator
VHHKAANAHPDVNDAVRSDPQLRQIWHEFAEMPGLRLTIAQAQRLCALDRATCAELLESLVSARLLVRGGDGRYSRQLTAAANLVAAVSSRPPHKYAV